MTTGGGGDWLYDFEVPAAPWTAYREKVDQHVVVTIEGGTMKIESVRSSGTVHDAFTIMKDVPPLPPPGREPPPGCKGLACLDGAGSRPAIPS